MPLFIPDFTKLWSVAYLFGPAGFELARSDKIFFVMSLVLVLAASVFKLVALAKDKTSPAEQLLNRFFHLFLTTGILLLAWAGARGQGIPWVSTHFVALLILLIALTWLFFIFKFYFGKYRKDQALWNDEQIKRKYLAR